MGPGHQLPARVETDLKYIKIGKDEGAATAVRRSGWR